MKKVLVAIQAALAALVESKATGPRAESIRDHLKACESNAAAEVAERPEPADKDTKDTKGATGADGKKAGFARLGLLMVVAAVLWLACALAHADSFNMTNAVANAVVFAGPPTNSVGANGVCLGVGRAVNVANADNAAFTFYGQGSAAGTKSVDFTLVRARTAGPPTAADWETTGAITLYAPMNGTTPVVWCTNLNQQYIGGFNWVGIGVVTNNNTGAVTNSAAYLDKKIIPMRFP